MSVYACFRCVFLVILQLFTNVVKDKGSKYMCFKETRYVVSYLGTQTNCALLPHPVLYVFL